MISVRCKSCGYDNSPEARFCANCGSNLTAATAEPSLKAVPAPILVPPGIAMEHIGFWRRLLGALIDGVIINIGIGILGPLTHVLLHITPLVLLAYTIPFLYFWLFTGLKGQTPGKMVVGIKVVNDQGAALGLERAALREIPGKIISCIVLFLGFLWIIWDEQKQGWHDKIAKTYVVRVESRR